MLTNLQNNQLINESQLNTNNLPKQFAKKNLFLNIPSGKETPISNIGTNMKSLSLGQSISINTQLTCKKEKPMVVTVCTREQQNQLFSYSFVGGIKINQIQRQEKPTKKTTFYTPQISKTDQFVFDCEQEDDDW